MSLTATNAQVYKGTAAVTYGSGSGVSNRELQGTATITYGGAPTSNTALVTGSSNYMKLPTTDPTNFDPSTSNVFIEAWIYWNGANWTSPSLGGIYERDNVSVQDYGLYVDGSVAKLTAFMYTQNGSILRPVYNPTLSVQTWIHVAFGYNIANQTAYVWVNGNIGTTSTASNPARYTGSSIFTSIGASPHNGVTSMYWNGYIRDVRVVKGGNIPTTSFTPAGAPFRLNTPSYVTGGSVVFSMAEQYFTPSWVALPGTQGSYLDFGVPSGPYFASTFNTFIQGWVYINSTAANAGYIIMSTPTTEVSAEDWAIRVLSGGTVQFYIYNSSAVSSGVTSSSSLTAGRWYHIAVSYVYNTGTYGTMYMFVNGVFQNSSAMSGGFPRFSATNRITIGSRLTTLGWSPLNSYIQDLQVVLRGTTVPTTTFTPAAAPFGLASPSYVTSGTTVLSLATQYYQTGLSGIAPSTTLTNMNRVYSLQNVNTSYTGNIINIRRSTDSANTDFKLDSTNTVLVTASSGQTLTSWLGGGTANVVIWYDQSGNGRNLTQTTNSLQPRFSQTTGVQFRSGVYMVWTDNVSITDVTFCVGFIQNAYIYGNPSTAWYFQDSFIPGDIGGAAQDYGLLLPGSGLFGMATGTSDTKVSISTNGLGNYSFMTATRASSTGQVILYNGTGTGSSFTLDTGTKSGPSQTALGYSTTNTTAAPCWINADVSNFMMFNEVKDSTTVATLANKFRRSLFYSGINFTSRPPLTPVLTNPGTQTGTTFTVSQTAPQPANGITWTVAPTGQGVTIASFTDYVLNGSIAGGTPQQLFTISATNRANQTTVSQFLIGNMADPTGGTITTSGGYRIHTFSSVTTATFTFTTFTTKTAQTLVVAGGGGGGVGTGGGGGAGGLLYSASTSFPAGSYTITVGRGGPGGLDVSPWKGTKGDNSSIVGGALNIVAVGGGPGGRNTADQVGGSGGGGSGSGGGASTPGQGNNGGASGGSNFESGGGGGAGTAGGNAATGAPGAGGNGVSYSISGTAVTYAGGGGGGTNQSALMGGAGGTGGGGKGGSPPVAGTNGLGGGGGGGNNTGTIYVGGAGGSGVVIIAYLYP